MSCNWSCERTFSDGWFIERISIKPIKCGSRLVTTRYSKTCKLKITIMYPVENARCSKYQIINFNLIIPKLDLLRVATWVSQPAFKKLSTFVTIHSKRERDINPPLMDFRSAPCHRKHNHRQTPHLPQQGWAALSPTRPSSIGDEFKTLEHYRRSVAYCSPRRYNYLFVYTFIVVRGGQERGELSPSVCLRFIFMAVCEGRQEGRRVRKQGKTKLSYRRRSDGQILSDNRIFKTLTKRAIIVCPSLSRDRLETKRRRFQLGLLGLCENFCFLLHVFWICIVGFFNDLIWIGFYISTEYCY